MAVWQVSAAKAEVDIVRATVINHIDRTDDGTGRDLWVKWIFRPNRNSVARNIQRAAVYCVSKSGAFTNANDRVIRYSNDNRKSFTTRIRSYYNPLPSFSALKKLKLEDGPCYTDCSIFAATIAEIAVGQKINAATSVYTQSFDSLMGDPVFKESFTQITLNIDPAVPGGTFDDLYPDGKGLRVGDILVALPTNPNRKGESGHAYIVVDTVGTDESFQTLYKKVIDNKFSSIFATVDDSSKSKYFFKPTYKNQLFGQSMTGDGGVPIKIGFLDPSGDSKKDVKYASAVYCVDDKYRILAIQNALEDIDCVFVGDSRTVQLRKFLKSLAADTYNKRNKDLYYDMYPSRNVYADWEGRLFSATGINIPEENKWEDTASENTKRAIRMMTGGVNKIVFWLGINDIQYEFLWRRRKDKYLIEYYTKRDAQPFVPFREQDIPFYGYRQFKMHDAKDYADRLKYFASQVIKSDDDARVYICGIVNTDGPDVDVYNTLRPGRQIAGQVRYHGTIIDSIPGQAEFIAQINQEIKSMCEDNDYTYVDFGQTASSDYVSDKFNMQKSWFEAKFKTAAFCPRPCGDGQGSEYFSKIDPSDFDWQAVLDKMHSDGVKILTKSGREITEPRSNPITHEQQVYDVPDVCDGVPQSGVIASNTPYVKWFSKWGWTQRKIADEWDAQGRLGAFKIAQVSGYFLLAMTHYKNNIDGWDFLTELPGQGVGYGFGTTGDIITIVLEDGTFFNAMYGDAKGPDALNRWGHTYPAGAPPKVVDIIEWELNGTEATGPQQTELENGLRQAGWFRKKVKHVINWGSYFS